MDNNLTDFIDLGHDHPSSFPSSRPILRTDLATFDDASYQSSTIYTEAPSVASLDSHAHRPTGQVLELSLEGFDGVIAVVGKKSSGFQGYGNTTPSSSPDGVSSPHSHSDNNAWVDCTNDLGCHSGSGSVLQDTQVSTPSNHKGVVGSNGHCSLDNFATLDSPDALHNSDSLFDSRHGNSCSGARQYSASGLDDLRSLVGPIRASCESTVFGPGFPSTISPQQQGNQSLIANPPGCADEPCSMSAFLSEYQPKQKPSGPPRGYNNTYTIDPRDVIHCTSSNGMALELVHDDEPIMHHKRRKPSSKRRQSSSDETFLCSVCTTFSGDVPSLIEHMRCHNRSHICRAPGCTRSFSTSRDLTRHTKSAHSKTVLMCSLCSAVIKGNRMDNLQRHIRNRHSARAITQASPSDCSSRSGPGDYTLM